MKKILIAASGSGGHLFPAIYIAEALKAQEQDLSLSFLGSGRPLEEKIFSKCGKHPIYKLDIVGVKNRGVRGAIEFFLKLPRALKQGWKLLSEVQPDCIVGVGGYVTVLPVILGRLRGIPSWIHEAELSPGLANYLLSFFATKVSIAFREAVMPTSGNVVFTGHPVRPGLDAVSLKQKRTEPPRNLLIMGGSQGAASLDETLPQLGETIRALHLTVRHQCRSDNVEKVTSSYKEGGVAATVVSFIDDMHEMYRWSDIIISRSGAGSVMELGIVNKPSILVPYPFAQGNHQLANAKTLSDPGKAILCEEGPLFKERLSKSLNQICDLNHYNAITEAHNPNRATDAATSIAKGILALTE